MMLRLVLIFPIPFRFSYVKESMQAFSFRTASSACHGFEIGRSISFAKVVQEASADLARGHSRTILSHTTRTRTPVLTTFRGISGIIASRIISNVLIDVFVYMVAYHTINRGFGKSFSSWQFRDACRGPAGANIERATSNSEAPSDCQQICGVVSQFAHTTASASPGSATS